MVLWLSGFYMDILQVPYRINPERVAVDCQVAEKRKPNLICKCINKRNYAK